MYTRFLAKLLQIGGTLAFIPNLTISINLQNQNILYFPNIKRVCQVNIYPHNLC